MPRANAGSVISFNHVMIELGIYFTCSLKTSYSAGVALVLARPFLNMSCTRFAVCFLAQMDGVATQAGLHQSHLSASVTALATKKNSALPPGISEPLYRN